jgi:hypothetical protein
MFFDFFTQKKQYLDNFTKIKERTETLTEKFFLKLNENNSVIEIKLKYDFESIIYSNEFKTIYLIDGLMSNFFMETNKNINLMNLMNKIKIDSSDFLGKRNNKNPLRKIIAYSKEFATNKEFATTYLPYTTMEKKYSIKKNFKKIIDEISKNRILTEVKNPSLKEVIEQHSKIVKNAPTMSLNLSSVTENYLDIIQPKSSFYEY